MDQSRVDYIPNLKLNKQIGKFRAVNSDIQKGKSAGYRIVFYQDNANLAIYPLAVYCKSEKENISIREIEKLIQELEAKTGL
ncbi:MAG: hypothetical protein Q8O10_09975 [candidate division Zixibacteria bacterium]|nr:hypothetical protein [candidate division Zixibacteria bacterium]